MTFNITEHPLKLKQKYATKQSKKSSWVHPNQFSKKSCYNFNIFSAVLIDSSISYQNKSNYQLKDCFRVGKISAMWPAWRTTEGHSHAGKITSLSSRNCAIIFSHAGKVTSTSHSMSENRAMIHSNAGKI